MGDQAQLKLNLLSLFNANIRFFYFIVTTLFELK